MSPTRTTPTEPGFYWLREPGEFAEASGRWIAVEIVCGPRPVTEGELFASFGGWHDWRQVGEHRFPQYDRIPDTAEWAGPIPQPTEA